MIDCDCLVVAASGLSVHIHADFLAGLFVALLSLFVFVVRWFGFSPLPPPGVFLYIIL